MTGLILLRPAWLLAIVGLLLAAWGLRRRRAGVGDWSRVADTHMMSALRALGHVDESAGAIRGWLALAAAGIIVVAMAGPAVERRDASAFRNLDAVVLVLDASPSVTASADWSAMMTMGRFAISSLGSRPAGLIVYAGDAYVATDLTADTGQLGQTLSLVTAETVPDPGSRPERGLSLAAQMLAEGQVLAGDVILLTDGGGLGPASLQQAAAIAGAGARLSVIAPDPAEPEIAVLTQAGEGRAFGLADAEDLASFLKDDGRTRLEQQDWPLLFWADRGRLLLLLALVPMVMLFRRRAE
ncbi:Ca-activated chloride channel family protein [Poseidonocella pacifica]|uniref:Ca-activated chloride channel family protein n=1 Tax=Poseidonocella pacifica TaxID=871651 RepID=A0A1I0YFT2_9RHOB|nr:VWA domain-containing protein [Poseidonocella pacifica]SFB12219.1 Ca-activated chloride channel family protein [Poseidonocella pacifica]